MRGRGQGREAARATDAAAVRRERERERDRLLCPAMPLRNIVIANLAEVTAARAALPANFRPTKQANGRWHMAKWGALRIARERRRTLLRGESWPWVVPRKQVVKRVAFKGHKRDARKLEQAAEVERCMARMPEMVAAYRAARSAARAARKVEKARAVGFADLVAEPRSRMDGVVTRTTPAPPRKGKGAEAA
jgi:hypothetical protein